MEQDQPIMPQMEVFNPRQYLADRVKRGVAFVAVLRSVGSVTEPCLSTHIKKPPTEPYIDDSEIGDHYTPEQLHRVDL